MAKRLILDGDGDGRGLLRFTRITLDEQILDLVIREICVPFSDHSPFLVCNYAWPSGTVWFAMMT